MDSLKFLLFVSLSLVLFLLWQAWQQDYGQETVVEETAQDVPTAPTTPVPKNEKALDAPVAPELFDSGEQIQVVTDLLRLKIGTVGGGINYTELLQYPEDLDKPDQPVRLLDNVPPLYYLVQGGLLGEANAPTHNAVFYSPTNNYILKAEDETLSVPMVWESPDDSLKITKIYTFHRNQYLIDVEYQIENNTPQHWSGRAYGQIQRSDPGRTSRILYTYTGAAFSSPEKRYKKISFSDMHDQNIQRDIQDGWVAMLQHYFLSALVPASREEYNNFYSKVYGDKYIVGMLSPEISVATGESGSIRQKLYLGPKIQSRLESIAPGLELAVDYGLLWFLAKPLFWCLEKFYSLTGNWGWSIVLITLMLKIVFFKLSAAGYQSMARMRKLQPRLLALRERYKGDRMRLNQAMMDIYKTEKINPLGGCFPILVQIPVFIALYWVLLESVELRQAGFIFWLDDLSSPDPWFVLPLIMGVTMFIQQKLNPAPIDPIQAKVISVLPFVFTVFFAFFPCGLVLYWVVNNILSIAQQWLITRKLEHA